MDLVKRIGIDDLVEAAGTSGIHRWLAIAEEGFWAGLATTDPEVDSGWHHHSDHHSLVYILEGRVRVEWGAENRASVEAGSGEFLHVPPYLIHREVNPDPSYARAIVIRIGQGEPVVNVPAPQISGQLRADHKQHP